MDRRDRQTGIDEKSNVEIMTYRCSLRGKSPVRHAFTAFEVSNNIVCAAIRYCMLPGVLSAVGSNIFQTRSDQSSQPFADDGTATWRTQRSANLRSVRRLMVKNRG